MPKKQTVTHGLTLQVTIACTQLRSAEVTCSLFHSIDCYAVAVQIVCDELGVIRDIYVGECKTFELELYR